MGKTKNVKDIYSLSPLQEGMLFHWMRDKNSSAYFEQVEFTLKGNIDIALIEKSVNRVIERDDILRTVFVYEKIKKPLQVVLKQRTLNVHFEDISGMAKQEKASYIEEFKRNDRAKGFDLSKDMLIRLSVLKSSAEEYKLIWSFHHILMDGWCIQIINQYLIQNYQNLKEEIAVEPVIAAPYSRYIQWLGQQDKEEGLNHWQDYLKGYEHQATLPRLKKAGPDNKNAYEKAVHPFIINGDLRERLFNIAKENHVTLNIVFQAIWGLVLQGYNNTNDVVFGTVVSGRPSEIESIEHIVGLFINTIPVRIKIEKPTRFSQLLLELKCSAALLKAYEYIPLTEIQARTVLKRNLIDHIIGFEYHPTHQSGQEKTGSIPNAEIQVEEISIHEQTNYDFNLAINAGVPLTVRFIFNRLVYSIDFMKKIESNIKKVVEQVVNNPGIDVQAIDIIDKKEKKQLLFDFNYITSGITDASHPDGNKTLHQLFEEEVSKRPDNIAVVYEGQQLTYSELNRYGNQLGHFLRTKGVKRDTIVGIIVERSIKMLTCILGILKAGGAYLPIDPGYPQDRIISMVDDCEASILLTENSVVKQLSFIGLQDIQSIRSEPLLTRLRPQITDFDSLNMPDRSLINYEKCNQYIGQPMVKNCISLQATRGCPYNCAFCHKIWPKNHVSRSAENIFAEVQVYYNLGIRRFAFVDDIFNLNKENSKKFFNLIIENKLNVQLFFPAGLRGDILTKDYIDLMIKAGTVNFALALETASPRLQKLIGKHLNIEKLRENIEYISKTYPHVILELFTMHSFPSETREEAMMTLDFIKSIKWLHFPYISILRIYPSTDMAKLALENGISNETIFKSADLALHKLPETLVFDKSFTLKYQADFLNEYFMSKERLLHVLPYQMKVLTEDEIVQKYNSYLPTEIYSFNQLLNFIGITREELGVEKCVDETKYIVPCLNEKMKKIFPKKTPSQDALRILLLDLSQFFGSESNMLYDVVEPPLGLMYLLTYLNQRFGSKINGRIAKSRIDFDNSEVLKDLLDQFQPDVIGIRSLTFHRNFFHKTVALIRSWGFDVPIITGGPYATSDYTMILQDRNIDLVVRGEGEITFSEIIGEIIANGKKFPGDEALKEIPGIAFVPRGKNSYKKLSREILIMEELNKTLSKEPHENPGKVNQPSDLAYVIYTSGSTGKPKGAVIEHRNVASLMFHHKFPFDFKSSDVWTMFHSYSFDFSVWEMYGALLYGGKLIVIPKIVSQNSPRYLEVLKEQGVTILNQTPTAFYRLMDEEIGTPQRELNLRYVIFGGEALNPVKIKKWQEKYPLSKMINMFGITETTVHVTYKEMTGEELESSASNIGRPLQTLHCYVMDRNMKLLPVGAPGELFVGGYGVGRGYLNRPGLSKERFIKNLYKPDERLYRTGDLVRLLENGEMEYLGRIDHQVKIRGFRVELGEIECQLLDQPPVKDAVVAISEHNTGDKRLIAYVVPDPELAFTVRKLLELEKKDRKDRLIYELQNGMTIFYLNKNERDFMYREIFQDRSYMKHGIQLEEGGCIFDVGANIGMFSLFVNQICKNAKIYTFEPIPPIFEVLTLNISMYGENIKAFEYGISAQEGEMVFNYYPHATALSGPFTNLAEDTRTVAAYIRNQQSSEEDTEKLSDGQIHDLLQNRLSSTQYKCHIKTFSQIIQETGVEKIDLLKIDVEKCEIDVLNGINEEDWQKIRQLVIEVHDIDGRLRNITDLLEKKGYEVAVEQDPLLKNTDLYNLYAIPPKQNKEAGRRRDKPETTWNSDHRWYSPERLKNDMRMRLKEKLPEYMIPSFFVLLNEIPLTANGKLDRKALPAPETGLNQDKYVAPGNNLEKKLTEICSEVLGIDEGKFGINHDFFEAGGDSISAIKLISRCSRENIHIHLKDILEFPTIKELVKNVDLKNNKATIVPQKGETKALLTPIQKWFFEMNTPHPNFWNVSFLFKLIDEIDLEILEKSLWKMIEYHDGLRVNFIEEKGTWKQICQDMEDIDFSIEYITIKGKNKKERNDKKHHEINRIQDSLKLGKGLLLKCAVLNMGKSKRQIFFTIHHLIFDIVSIHNFFDLLSYIYKTYSGHEKNKSKEDLKIKMPPRSTSILEWSHKLYSEIKPGDIDVSYWKEMETESIDYMVIEEKPQSFFRDISFAYLTLDKRITRKLKEEVTRYHDVTIEEILLSALVIALNKTMGLNNILIELESHGREPLFDNVELSRSIGWFTNKAPILLEYKGDIESTILNTREVIRGVVNRGIHYNIAKYILELEDLPEIEGQISFNYRGDMTWRENPEDNQKLENIILKTDEFILPVHPGNNAPFIFEVLPGIADSKLYVSIHYDKTYLKPAIIKNFGNHYLAALKKMAKPKPKPMFFPGFHPKELHVNHLAGVRI